MNDEVLQISMDDLAAGMAIHPDMLRDLLVVGSIETPSVQALSQTISSLTGLHTGDAIKDVLKNALPESEKEHANSVFRVLLGVNSDKVSDVLSTLKGWVNRKEIRKQAFSDELQSRLKRNLEDLINEYPAIELMKKADQLVRDTGDELDSVKFICDLRPVFDQPRENVDAFVLIANMRIRYLAQNGRRYTCELALTEEELSNFKDEIEQATKKLEVLKRVGATLGSAREGNSE